MIVFTTHTHTSKLYIYVCVLTKKVIYVMVILNNCNWLKWKAWVIYEAQIRM